jgi:hypothetical protein
MATDKLFTVAGTSKHPEHGFKVRFANDSMRVKNLAKSGHTDITLIELDAPMTKLDAINFIKTLDEFQGVAEQSAIADYLDRNDEKPAKAPKAEAPAKTAKVKAPKVAAPKATVATAPAGKTHAQKAAEAALMDDAPF